MIDIENLHKSFGDVHVLKGIDLNIKEKEVVAIIGPSGSGKSTLLRCMNYLEEPTQGMVSVDGILLDGEANINKVREEVGMVFQRFNLFPHMDIMKNLILAPMKLQGKSQQEAEAEEKKGNHVTAVEGGFRRIVAAPNPVSIVEIDAIKALLDADQVVIACGGGGIPVLEQDHRLKGASAVIEKDLTAGKMAEETDADMLIILTSVEKVKINMDRPEEEELREISVDQAKAYMEEGHFGKYNMYPKFRAAVEFLEKREGRSALITSFDKFDEALKGKTGTVIR